jgi:hypothetical protein
VYLRSGQHYWEVRFTRGSSKRSLGACYYVGVVLDDGKIDWEESLGEHQKNWCAPLLPSLSLSLVASEGQRRC